MRARGLNPDDEWLRPTLLGSAFHAQDVLSAQRLADDVIRDGIGSWKLETTIADLRFSALQAHDKAVARALAATFNRLNAALPPDKRKEPLPSEGEAEAKGTGEGKSKGGKKEKKGKRKKKNKTKK